jgi:hypothetical protein
LFQGFAEANDGETEAEEGGGIIGIGKERRGRTSHIGKHNRILPLKGQFCEESTVVNGWPICRRRIEDPGDQLRALYYQGVTKRCRLSLLTNSALVYEPKCGGSVWVAGSQPMSTAVHLEPL